MTQIAILGTLSLRSSVFLLLNLFLFAALPALKKVACRKNY
jgi:hypothetical protein